MNAIDPPGFAFLDVQPFFAAAAFAGIALAAVVLLGASRRHQSSGKAIIIAAGFLLLGLAGFVVFVLYLAASARHGAPM